ncbi:MAG: transposase family protein [Nitrospinota bacterium]
MKRIEFLDFFSDLEDPRSHNLLYPIDEILLTALYRVIFGADGWERTSSILERQAMVSTKVFSL